MFIEIAVEFVVVIIVVCEFELMRWNYVSIEFFPINMYNMRN